MLFVIYIVKEWSRLTDSRALAAGHELSSSVQGSVRFRLMSSAQVHDYILCVFI